MERRLTVANPLERLPLYRSNAAIWCTVLVYACSNLAVGLLFTVQPGQSISSRAYVYVERAMPVRWFGVLLLVLGCLKLYAITTQPVWLWPARLLVVGGIVYGFLSVCFARSAFHERWIGSTGAAVWSTLAAIHLITWSAATRLRPPAQ